ncbi:T9SS type A sorting domain-containing protein [candidate division WOR-3 bacterium]|nr:T9SS type A sorting domain-containing protein [candidate division WOR-3 bacterium]
MNRLAVSFLVLAAVAAGQGNYRLAEWVFDEGGRRSLPPAPVGLVANGSLHQTTIGLTASPSANLVASVGYWHPRPLPGPAHDVCAWEILAPVGRADTFREVEPTAVVANLGNRQEAFWAIFIIRHGAGRVYAESLPVDLAPYDSTVLSFPPVRLTTVGPHIACCSVYLASDTNRQNDTVSATFKVLSRPPWPDGWAEVRPLPLLPSGRATKGGAWLAHSTGSGLLYAAKGNKARDFFVYDAIADEWSGRKDVPLGREGKPLARGGVGTGDGAYSVYMTKGNNTVGFHRYDVLADDWTQLADVPLGPSKKRVKGGTDLAFVDRDGGGVYLLKGYRNEFYRYDVGGAVWESLPPAPVGMNIKWDIGSWLVYDGDSTLYAHKARVHELWRFDVRGDTWYSRALAPMPVFHRLLGTTKKSRYGGSAAWYQSTVFALKGGNTQEFWQYFAEGDSWLELDTLPSFGSTGKKKRVKEGADIAVLDYGVCYALKGNKTVEFWRYVPGAGVVAPGPRRAGVAGSAAEGRRFALQLQSNPAAGREPTIVYCLPGRPAGGIEVLDATGRVVWRQTLTRGEGSVRVRGLAAGVYLVRLSGDGRSASRQFVVCR